MSVTAFHFYFASTWALFLLALLPGYLAWYYLLYRPQRLSLRLSYDPAKLYKAKLDLTVLRYLPSALILLALVLMIFALARPQLANTYEQTTSSGIDIVLTLDVSKSMQTVDFKPNRLEVAKKIAVDFVGRRPNDRIGLVLFAEDAFRYAPLTLDHDLLKQLLYEVNKDMMPNDGTAMGNAVGIAVNELKEKAGSGKVLILVTDGKSNADMIDPLAAAVQAHNAGIKIYTIGVGKESYFGVDENDVATVVHSDLDEATLKQIAEITGGEFFRSTDEAALRQIFTQISAMERTAVQRKVFKTVQDEYPVFLFAALGLLTLAYGLIYFGVGNILEE